jgi:DNA-directed RNA polymerase subunit RPC12/RpoP
MREVIRDPAKTFRCPRCGAPVTYKGRGRRPVWCSARCRVEASIERRGNQIVGVKPEVVKVVSPTARLSDWEKERRQQIERDLDRDTVIEP